VAPRPAAPSAGTPGPRRAGRRRGAATGGERRRQRRRAARRAARARPAAPGPNELYRLATDQYRRGSYASARAGFQELLRRYPDRRRRARRAVLPRRGARGGEERGRRGLRVRRGRHALSAVLARPDCALQAARARAAGGRRAEARTLYDEVVRRYPRSDEAALAREALRAGS
jgi:TolA-binding protein